MTMMMIHSERRVVLSLRQHLHSFSKSNSPISRSRTPIPQNPNLNSPPFQFRDHQSRRFGARCLISRSLIPNWSSRGGFNGVRSFATRLAESSNRPPKETIMLEGCDFEHWLVVVEAPDPKLTRDDIIDGYIKTLSHVVGSEEEARMKIYSVSTRHYYAFSASLSEELAYKLKELPHVRWVLPDSYMDVKNKTYAGEPFINGQPVPYDPKYHEIWVRNHELSINNNMKNKKRQRDPNFSRPRSRSPPSMSPPSGLNENGMPAGYQNQVLKTSHMNNQTFQSSTPSSPDVRPRWVGEIQKGVPSSGSQNSHIENHSSSWAPPPPQPSTSIDPNFQRDGWQQNQNPTRSLGSQGQAQHPVQIQNRPPPPSPTSNPYTSTWDGQSQSSVSASVYQNRSSQPPNLSYDHMPPPDVARNIPSHMQNPDFYRGGSPLEAWQNGFYNGQNHGSPSGYRSVSVQHQPEQNSYGHLQSSNTMTSAPQVLQNGYYSRDISHDAQNGSSQSGYPLHKSQRQQYQSGFRDMQRSNAMASSQSWNYQNASMTPPLQNEGFLNPNMAPQVQDQRLKGVDVSRPVQNKEIQDNMGQVEHYSRGSIPSDTTTGTIPTREIQERDVPIDEEYMSTSK